MKIVGLLLAFVTAPLVSMAQAPAAGGDALYAKYKCSMCHAIGGKGGKMGPDLSKVGAKLDAAKIAAYTLTPKKVNPKAKMPAGKMTPAEADQIAAYLATLK